jgi:hypothetical protein
MQWLIHSARTLQVLLWSFSYFSGLARFQRCQNPDFFTDRTIIGRCLALSAVSAV